MAYDRTLQRNKVKYVVGRAAMIHSVESVRLAKAISEEAVKKNLVVDILVEVNVAGEENKFGLKPGRSRRLCQRK